MTRLLFTLAIFAVFALCVYTMWRGWQNRMSRQEGVIPAFPEPPRSLHGDLGEELLPSTTGVYVGTTIAGDWQDRVVIDDVGNRSLATLELSRAGLLVDRIGERPLWIPAESVRGARTAAGLAGKAMGRDGLLVVTWQLGEHLLDTGFRGDQKESYPRWVAAVAGLAAADDTATSTTDDMGDNHGKAAR